MQAAIPGVLQSPAASLHPRATAARGWGSDGRKGFPNGHSTGRCFPTLSLLSEFAEKSCSTSF